MNRWEYWLFHVSAAAVIGTGLVYGWMRYLSVPDSTFSVVNHPWQPHLQHLHILAAPLLVALLGHFAYRHAWEFWRNKVVEGRRSGVTIALLALPMVGSGYAVQVAVSSSWRTGWAWVHGLSSIAWILVFAGHVWIHLRAARNRSLPA